MSIIISILQIIYIIFQISYALTPVILGVFFYIYWKTGKFEIFTAILFVAIFIYGCIDCINYGLTLLGIEWFLKVIVMNKNFFHADNLTYFDEENIYPECDFKDNIPCDFNNTSQMDLFDIHLNCENFIMGHCFLGFGECCPYQPI